MYETIHCHMRLEGLGGGMSDPSLSDCARRRLRVRRVLLGGMALLAGLVVAWSYRDLHKARLGSQPEPFVVRPVFEMNARLLNSEESRVGESVIDGLYMCLQVPASQVEEAIDFSAIRTLDGSALLAVALDRRRSEGVRACALQLLETLCFGNAPLSSEVRDASKGLLQSSLGDGVVRRSCLRALRVAWLGTPLRTVLLDMEINDAKALSDLGDLRPDFEDGIAWFGLTGVAPATIPKSIEHNGRLWEVRQVRWEY